MPGYYITRNLFMTHLYFKKMAMSGAGDFME